MISRDNNDPFPTFPIITVNAKGIIKSNPPIDFKHRDDGPAVYYANGKVDFYINGKNINDEVDAWMKQCNIPHWSEWTKQEQIMFKIKFAE